MAYPLDRTDNIYPESHHAQMSSGSKFSFRFVIPVILGVAFAFGDSVASDAGLLKLSNPSLYLRAIYFCLIFVAVFSICEILLRKIFHASTSDESFLSKLDDRVSAKAQSPLFAVQLAFVILLCWAVWIYLFRPGIYWSDTSQQLLEHFGKVTLSDHHPYLVTLIFGLFADLGKTLFGSVSKGLYCLVLLQCVSASYIFSASLCYLIKNRASLFICILVFLFVCLFPFIPLMFSSLAKDTISAVFFMCFCLEFVKCINGDKSRKVVIFLYVSGLLCSLTKKTAAYVILLCLFLLVVFIFKKSLKKRVETGVTLTKWVGIFLSFAIFVFIFVPKIILPMLGVQAGGKQEAIAIPIQQVAHDVKFNGDRLSKQDYSVINHFLLTDTKRIPDVYDWQIVDPVKQRGLKDEKLMPAFMSIWFRNSFKLFKGHFEAWMGLVDGWFSFRIDQAGTPNYMVVLTYSGWHDEGIESVTDWNDQITNGGKICEELYRAIQSIPIVNLLFYRSFWASLFPAFVLFFIFGAFVKGERYRALLIFSPIFVSVLTLMIVPVSVMGGEPTRYLFAMICSSPFLFGVLLCRNVN